jgi:predicted outer membrane repeat protein
MLRSWLWALSNRVARPARHPARSRRPGGARPTLEGLEGRTLPAAYTVNALTDNNPNGGGQGMGNTGDLRYCLTQANGLAGPHTVTLDVNGTINLAAALPTLARDMTVTPGMNRTVTVAGSGVSTNPFRVFYVGVGVTATFGAFTIQKGYVTDDGGGILNVGTLTLQGTTVRQSYADGDGGAIKNSGALRLDGAGISTNQATYGGAIDNSGSVVTQGTGTTIISGNQVGISGGAIYNNRGASASLTKVVFRNNTAAEDGGAIYNAENLILKNCTFNTNVATNGDGGGVYSAGTASFTNNTFTNCSAGGRGGAIRSTGTASGTNNTVNGNRTATGLPPGPPGLSTYGAISAAYGSSFSLVNTASAGNISPRGPDVEGVFNDLGHNFIGDGTGANFYDGVNGDQVGTPDAPLDPQLGPLQDNGGGIDTELPLSGSRLIDAGDNAYAPDTDERGYVRIVNGTVDIGAAEYGSYPPPAGWAGGGLVPAVDQALAAALLSAEAPLAKRDAVFATL